MEARREVICDFELNAAFRFGRYGVPVLELPTGQGLVVK